MNVLEQKCCLEGLFNHLSLFSSSAAAIVDFYGDADYSNWGVNTANLVLINGDGWPDGFTARFPGAPQADYNNSVDLWRPGNPVWTVQMPTAYYNVNYNGSWGPVGPNDRLYWLAGLLCECLDEKDAAGLTNDKRWLSAFGGLHIFTGFASNAAYSAGAFPRAFGENILGVSGSPETILNAWFDASTSTSEGTAAAHGPDDHRWSYGYERSLYWQRVYRPDDFAR